MKHLTEEDLVLHYYGELAASDETRAVSHLGECHACRRELTSLQRVLGVVDETSLSQVDLPENFERTVWARLEPNLRRESGLRGWWLLATAPAPLALAATVILLVGAAFVAGRMFAPPAAPADTGTAAGGQVRERILLVDLNDHLDRSQMVLVELVGVDEGEESVDISGERARAEQLVAANRLYRQAAVENGEEAVADLLDELGRLFVDVASGPEHLTAAELVDVQRRIDSKSLLFKVRVVSSKVRDRQKEAVQERTGQRPISTGT